MIDNVSYVVREKLYSNEIGKIVGLCLNSIIQRPVSSNNSISKNINKNNAEEQNELIICTDLKSSSKIDCIKNILNQLELKVIFCNFKI